MAGAQIGPYRVLGDLGRGGMGKVYLAEVTGKAPGLDVGCRVALKVIHPHLLETPGFFKRFLREAEIGKSVEQDNVVRCFDCDSLVVKGTRYDFLVMEYVEGQTLRGLLEELGTVPEELCRHVGRELAKGLQAIHEAGVIHRDLKPENVLITEEHVVKVMDLGVAHLQDEVIRLSQTGVFVGSLEYASPEQFRSDGHDVDARSDLHALGVVLYELSTGQHPYRMDDAHTTLRNVIEGEARRAGEVNPQLSSFFEEVVHTLVAKEPGERFSSASTLLGILEKGEKSGWWKERAKTIRVQTKRPLRRIRVPRETALYGRDDDVARMKAAYEKTKSGEGQVLLIEGEAGIGKTRLVDEFVGRLRKEGEDLNFLFGSFPPGGAATAAGAFSTAYREQFGAEGLEDALKEYLTVSPVLIPSFAALLRGETTPTGAEPLTKDSLQTVFAHATRALAAERPTIVLIDDLHFAPEDGRALFASLALAIPGHPILLVGTMRPGVPEDWIANIERLEHASRTVLSRLGPKDLVLLLKDSFRSEHVAKGLAGQIALKSDGNPFFAFEIIRGLREGQFITQKPDGTWVTTQAIKGIQVPSSVLDLVQARIGDLDDVEHEMLDVAACCGFHFDPMLVAEVVGQAQVSALRRLGRIERRHQLVRSVGRDYAFDHHQVQEVLYAGLNDRLREAYHAALGRALARRAESMAGDAAEIDDASAVRITEHLLAGGQGAEALPWFDPALVHLEHGYQNEQLVELADRALAVPRLLEGRRRADVLLRKSERLRFLGRRDEQRSVLEEARLLAEADDDAGLQSRAWRHLGIWHDDAWEIEAGKAAHERSLDFARRADERLLEATAHHNLAGSHYRQENRDEARRHAEEEVAIARELGAITVEAGGLGLLGIIHLTEGRVAEARACIERQLELSLQSGERRAQGNALGYRSYVLLRMGRLEEAKVNGERELALWRGVGNATGEAVAAGFVAEMLIFLCRFDEAVEYAEEQRTVARRIGYPSAEASACRTLGAICEARGRYDEADDHFRNALGIARDAAMGNAESVAQCGLGIVARARGRLAEARSLLGSCEETLERGGGRQQFVFFLDEKARALRTLGRIDEARRVLRDALDRLRDAPDDQGLAYVNDALGTVDETAGHLEAAADRYRDAIGLRRHLHVPQGLAESLLGLGRVHLAAGRDEEARAALTEALDLARRHTLPDTLLRAACGLAQMEGGDASEALALLAEHESRVSHEGRIEVRFRFWEATQDETQLAAARRLLDHLVEHAPEEYRESMLEKVPLHRAIVKAWASRDPEHAKHVEGEHGGDEGG